MSNGEWARVIAHLRNLGCNDARAALAAAKSHGLTPQHVRAIADFWQSSNGQWKAGALHFRLRTGTPDQQPAEGWPLPDSAPGEAARRTKNDRDIEQAAEAGEIIRAGRKERLSDEEITKRLEAAGLRWPA